MGLLLDMTRVSSRVELELKVLGQVPIPAAKVAARARDDNEVIGVALYGSLAKGQYSGISDIDICIFLRPRKYRPEEMHRKRMQYVEAAASDKADVQLFQQLPLQVRSMVLKEGKLALMKDEAALYELAIQTIRDLEDFRKHYNQYLAGIANAKSG